MFLIIVSLAGGDLFANSAVETGPDTITNAGNNKDISKDAHQTLDIEPFGKVWIYRTAPHPQQVVLFVSGDGGWNLGVVQMARTIAEQGAVVVGIDIIHYLKYLESTKEQCYYPAGDLETLSKTVQQHLGIPDYIVPVLIGYSFRK